MSSYFKVEPIGYIQKNNEETSIEILEKFRSALKHLDLFSHVIVIWWISQRDDEISRSKLQVTPPFESPLTGVFACRSPNRPNPIGITVVNILGVNEKEGIVHIRRIDAFDKTPVIDLKGYFPSSDRVEDCRVPKWFESLPNKLSEA